MTELPSQVHTTHQQIALETVPNIDSKLLNLIGNLDKRIETLVKTVESLLSVGSVVYRDDEILENNRLRELARKVLSDLK